MIVRVRQTGVISIDVDHVHTPPFRLTDIMQRRSERFAPGSNMERSWCLLVGVVIWDVVLCVPLGERGRHRETERDTEGERDERKKGMQSSVIVALMSNKPSDFKHPDT